MLYAGAAESVWNWYILAYFTVAAPMLALALVRPFADWRDRKLPPQDTSEE